VQFGRSVGRLDVLTDKGIHRCTAFIVSKLYILTNYHCSLGVLENARIDATRIDAITFVAGYTQTGIEEGTRKYTVIPTPIEASKELDYAVLEVVGDPSQEYGELKLASLAPQGGDPF
jgi:V8-like Glu-specific endopeptidase